MSEESEPFPSSLCHRCEHHRYVKTKRSTFILCEALPNKYPPQPVLACPAYMPASSADAPKR